MLVGQKWSCASDVKEERGLNKNLDCREGIGGMPRVEFWAMGHFLADDLGA